jgi:hypothetical protein
MYRKFRGRLTKYFNDINKNTDYFAAQDHTCCTSCGHNDIVEAMVRKLGDSAGFKIGYVFYHMQDADSIKEACEFGESAIVVHLGLGAFSDDEEEILQTCTHMFQTLKILAIKYNMELKWEGTMNCRMELHIDCNID